MGDSLHIPCVRRLQSVLYTSAFSTDFSTAADADADAISTCNAAFSTATIATSHRAD